MGVLPKVYVVILNWNGWKDTIECLESVFKNSYSNYRVIVCDNDSTDGSVERIKDWAEGRLLVQLDTDSPLHDKSWPPVDKPIRWVEYGREKAEQGGDPLTSEAPLVLISTGGNLGFAGGNNVGLRYALARGDFDYVWLLNNDTVINAVALVEMVQQMEDEPESGICGSTLLYYHNPEKVQTLCGGVYYKWLGAVRYIGQGLHLSQKCKITRSEVLNQLDYVLGASMLVRKSFLQQIGLMNEDYFLYFEEIDWAMRGKHIFSLTYANNSIVYHKEGGSTRRKKVLEAIPDYYGVRNRLLFARKFHPYTLPGIYVGLAVACLNRLRRGQVDRAGMILKLIIRGK